MKKLMLVPVLVVLVIALVVNSYGQTTSTPVKPKVLSFAFSMASEGWISEQAKWWAAELEKRTGGRLKVQFYWSQSLVSTVDQLKGIRTGLVDVATPSPTFTPADVPLNVAMNNPFNVSNDYASVMASSKVLDKVPALKNEWLRNNAVPVGIWCTGSFELLLRKPVSRLADLKGKVVRTFGGGRSKMWTTLGLSPVFMAWSEIYEAMQRGVVEGADIVMTLSDASRHYEVGKAVALIHSGTVACNYIVMNRKVYDGLSQDIKDIIAELRHDYDLHLAQSLVGETQRLINKWKTQEGVTFFTFPEEDMARMKEVAAEVSLAAVKEQGKKSGMPDEAMKAWQEYQKLVKQYQTEVATKGYPWEK